MSNGNTALPFARDLQPYTPQIKPVEDHSLEEEKKQFVSRNFLL